MKKQFLLYSLVIFDVLLQAGDHKVEWFASNVIEIPVVGKNENICMQSSGETVADFYTACSDFKRTYPQHWRLEFVDSATKKKKQFNPAISTQDVITKYNEGGESIKLRYDESSMNNVFAYFCGKSYHSHVYDESTTVRDIHNDCYRRFDTNQKGLPLKLCHSYYQKDAFGQLIKKDPDWYYIRSTIKIIDIMKSGYGYNKFGVYLDDNKNPG
jgi:hypothetical protein